MIFLTAEFLGKRAKFSKLGKKCTQKTGATDQPGYDGFRVIKDSIITAFQCIYVKIMTLFSVDGTEQECETAANCLWLVTNSKPCPNCKSPIQKNEGCNHMKCSKVHFFIVDCCLECMICAIFLS